MPRRAVLILLAPARLKNHPRRWQRLSRFGQTTIPQPFFQRLLTATISCPIRENPLDSLSIRMVQRSYLCREGTIVERDFAAQGAVKMKYQAGRTSNSRTARARISAEKSLTPTRREFLRTAAGATLALSGSPLAAFADHHGHPSPNSISYLDRRTYIRNMEVLAHFMPGHVRNGKMQLMSVGNRRYMFQQGDVIDVSDVRKPAFYNKGGFEGGQVQVAFNRNLKKWILMTGAQTPITD